MAIITDMLAALGAALAAFFGHIVAHDFIEFTPKLSRSLIQRATIALPKRDRARYREEWLADLNDKPGVLAKLMHAFGCLRCARRMRRESLRHFRGSRVIRLQIAGAGNIELDLATAYWAFEAILWIGRRHRYRWLHNHAGAQLSYQLTKFKLRQLGAPNPDKMTRVIKMIAEADDNAEMKLWINGRLVEDWPKRK